jgi:hypothetical protein
MLPALLRHRLTYYLLAWAVALTASGVALHHARHAFDDADRRDGNWGHATIDFGGQYLMGRMLVTGHGRQLYDRTVQREVLRPAYPDEDGEPDKPDVDKLMSWIMGGDDARAAEVVGSFAAPLAAAGPVQAAALLAAGQGEWTGERVRQAAEKQVGGPLYPPVNAFLYGPLALLAPRTAYHLQQIANLGLAFAAGLGLRQLSRGRVWWPVATTALMIFPGFGGSINLGQNAILTLVLLIWGWLLAARGRPGWGGAVWGLLAFKPVWAMAFFLVPLLSRRRRFGLAMLATGAALGLATLPFVGLQSWLDWLHVGREAAALYKVDENWIFLSRDLLSVPRRWLLDFKGTPEPERDADWLTPALIGWALIAVALEATVRLAVLRRRQAQVPDGPPAAFLLLGAWLCCFHFMYYDVLLAVLPVFLLFTEPRRYLQPLLLAVLPLRRAAVGAGVIDYHRAALPRGLPPDVPPLPAGYRHLWVLNRLAPTVYVLIVATHYVFPRLGLGDHKGTPWDTFCLMGLWAWCGWQWLRHGTKVATTWDEGVPPAGEPRSSSSLAPTSSARMRVSPTSTARTPAAWRRSTSARLRVPLSLTRQRSVGMRPARSRVCSRRVTKVRRSRLLTPIRPAPLSITRGRLAASYSSTSACSPRACACRSSAGRAWPSRISAMSSTASAPARRASRSW